jgi:uncharacterized protein YjbI with pentapeptide repeats
VKADLSAANFSWAFLEGVDFSGSKLTGASMRGATVKDVIGIKFKKPAKP